MGHHSAWQDRQLIKMPSKSIVHALKDAYFFRAFACQPTKLILLMQVIFFAMHHRLCLEAPHSAIWDSLSLDSPGRYNTDSNVARGEDASILNDLGRKLFFCLAILRNGCWWIFHKHSHSQKGICKAVDIPGRMTNMTHVNFERSHHAHLQRRCYADLTKASSGRCTDESFTFISSRHHHVHIVWCHEVNVRIISTASKGKQPWIFTVQKIEPKRWRTPIKSSCHVQDGSPVWHIPQISNSCRTASHKITQSHSPAHPRQSHQCTVHNCSPMANHVNQISWHHASNHSALTGPGHL